MTKPTSFLVRMAVFLVAVTLVAGLLYEALMVAFVSNPLLNSLILGVLLLGIFWNLRQVALLGPEVTWLESYQQTRARLAGAPAPRLLAPMANMLAAREGGGRTAAPASRSPPRPCAACWTASPPGWTKAANCRAT